MVGLWTSVVTCVGQLNFSSCPSLKVSLLLSQTACTVCIQEASKLLAWLFYTMCLAKMSATLHCMQYTDSQISFTTTDKRLAHGRVPKQQMNRSLHVASHEIFSQFQMTPSAYMVQDGKDACVRMYMLKEE